MAIADDEPPVPTGVADSTIHGAGSPQSVTRLSFSAASETHELMDKNVSHQMNALCVMSCLEAIVPHMSSF